MVDFQNDIDECLKVLNAGGMILYPTDTIWGIGCDATNERAVESIYKLKHRPDQKTMIVLVAGEKDILKYTAAVDLAVFDHLEKQEKPTTVIYDGAIGLAQNLVADDGSIGMRICKDDFCRQLIKRFRKPIVSTSANISGQLPPKNFREVTEEIKNGVDYVVHYRKGETQASQPSSIIRWRNGKIEVIRP
jgi:L-threonylcarbamoyladenylate synthase